MHKCSYGNLSSSEPGTSVQSNAISTGTAIDFNLTRVRLEVLCWIFRRNSALNGESAFSDGLLGQAKLSESCSGCDLNLCRNDVDAVISSIKAISQDARNLRGSTDQ